MWFPTICWFVFSSLAVWFTRPSAFQPSDFTLSKCLVPEALTNGSPYLLCNSRLRTTGMYFCFLTSCGDIAVLTVRFILVILFALMLFSFCSCSISSYVNKWSTFVFIQEVCVVGYLVLLHRFYSCHKVPFGIQVHPNIVVVIT